MYYKVTKGEIRKGRVKLTFSFYLDPEDYGYDKKFVEVPIVPPEGYLGEIDKDGVPIDQKNFDKWFDKLPTRFVNTPFHNHKVYFENDNTNEEIKFVGEWGALVAKRLWDKDLSLTGEHRIKNKPVKAISITPERITECEIKLSKIMGKKIKETVVDIWAQ